MKRLNDPNMQVWHTKRAGGYVLLCFTTWIRAGMGIYPVYHETIIGRVVKGGELL